MKRLLLVVFAAATAAFSQDYTTFKPVFDTNVYIINAGVLPNNPQHLQAQTPVAPMYALSEASAMELLVVLQEYKPVLFHAGPFGWAKSGGYGVSRLVPWLVFPDGSAIDAGLLAWYWSHGFSESYLKGCIALEMAWLARAAETNYPFSSIQGYPVGN